VTGDYVRFAPIATKFVRQRNMSRWAKSRPLRDILSTVALLIGHADGARAVKSRSISLSEKCEHPPVDYKK
jgi:hypothetical protein